MLLGLECVDPLSGEYPRVTEQAKYGLADRMRNISRGRSREDLDRMTATINRMLVSKELRAEVWRQSGQMCEAGDSSDEPQLGSIEHFGLSAVRGRHVH
ncbi:MAG: hypothetical protein KDH15_12245 [Rhodocyclaceae bacterium]|nr:hypothetical protein [Rhodocyclaceae bacterium]